MAFFLLQKDKLSWMISHWENADGCCQAPKNTKITWNIIWPERSLKSTLWFLWGIDLDLINYLLTMSFTTERVFCLCFVHCLCNQSQHFSIPHKATVWFQKSLTTVMIAVWYCVIVVWSSFMGFIRQRAAWTYGSISPFVFHRREKVSLVYFDHFISYLERNDNKEKRAIFYFGLIYPFLFVVYKSVYGFNISLARVGGTETPLSSDWSNRPVFIRY